MVHFVFNMTSCMAPNSLNKLVVTMALSLPFAQIALLVVTPTELRVLLSQLRPPSSAERIIEIRPRHHTYWLGRLGEHNVIVARYIHCLFQCC